MKKKTELVRLIIFILISLLAYKFIESKKDIEVIQGAESVNVRHAYFGGSNYYKINFEDNGVWTYSQWYNDKEKNEFVFSHYLDEKETENILTAMSNILDWKDEYRNERETDGHYWYVTITFEDGTEKVVGGYNKYPLNYSKVRGVFKKNVGLDVFEK